MTTKTTLKVIAWNSDIIEYIHMEYPEANLQVNTYVYSPSIILHNYTKDLTLAYDLALLLETTLTVLYDSAKSIPSIPDDMIVTLEDIIPGKQDEKEIKVIDFYDSIENGYKEFSNFFRGVVIDKLKWSTPEHAFHAKKFTGEDPSVKEYQEIIRRATTAGKSKMLGNQKISGQWGARTILDPKTDRRLLSEIISQYKDLGVHIRPDWEDVKDSVMLEIVEAKFNQHRDLQALLLGTGEKILREASPGDIYWGIGKKGEGKNMLGITLMIVRDRLKGKKDRPISYWKERVKEAAKIYKGTDEDI